MAEIPPISPMPAMIIANSETIITVPCKASVHRTAFNPPLEDQTCIKSGRETELNNEIIELTSDE